jgi:hypothetical protein
MRGMKRQVAIAFVGVAVGLAAGYAILVAIHAVGWFLIWGDNGPPEWATNSRVDAIGFGMLALIGGLLGWRLGRP